MYAGLTKENKPGGWHSAPVLQRKKLQMSEITFVGANFEAPISSIRMYSDSTTMVKTDAFAEICEKADTMILRPSNLSGIEENEWHDQFWGNCSCDQHVTTPGTNMLGELLMSLRFHLQG